MLRIIFSAVCLALALSLGSAASQASPTTDAILERLNALEKENANLRKRVQRLEGEREQLRTASVSASAPASPSSPTAARSATIAAPALPPAANQAFAAYPVQEQVRNWTGAYAGISAGARREDHTWQTNSFMNGSFASSPNSQDFNDTTARIGGFVGYNWQMGPRLVAGIEGDFAWGKTSTGTNHAIPGTGVGVFPIFGGLTPNDSSSFETSWDASLRARLGALITPDTLAYITGGAAWQRIKATATCDASVPLPGVCAFESVTDTQSKTLGGWTLGAGIETALWGYWTGRIEYRYSQFRDFNHLFLPTDCCDGNVDTTIKLATHTFSAGVAYRFSGY